MGETTSIESIGFDELFPKPETKNGLQLELLRNGSQEFIIDRPWHQDPQRLESSRIAATLNALRILGTTVTQSDITDLYHAFRSKDDHWQTYEQGETTFLHTDKIALLAGSILNARYNHDTYAIGPFYTFDIQPEVMERVVMPSGKTADKNRQHFIDSVLQRLPVVKTIGHQATTLVSGGEGIIELNPHNPGEFQVLKEEEFPGLVQAWMNSNLELTAVSDRFGSLKAA